MSLKYRLHRPRRLLFFLWKGLHQLDKLLERLLKLRIIKYAKMSKIGFAIPVGYKSNWSPNPLFISINYKHCNNRCEKF